MHDQDEFFSVYGNGGGFAERRQEGLKLFKASLPRRATKAAWGVAGILIAGGLALIAQSAVPQAHAGAVFILHHFAR